MSDIVYNPLRNRDPLAEAKWANDRPFSAVTPQEAYWKERAEMWRTKAEQLEKNFAQMFPVGEAPGRIVILFWDGKTWRRLEDRAYAKGLLTEETQIAVEVRDGSAVLRGNATFNVPQIEPDWKAEYERLNGLVKKAEGQQWASPAVQAVFKAVQGEPEPVRVERTRRNNVVT